MSDLDYNEYLKLSEEFDLIPVSKQMYADTLTPVQALRRLKEMDERVFLLESADNSGVRGRYSFLGFNPSMEIKLRDGRMEITNSETEVFETDNPTGIIDEILSKNKSPVLENLPNFTGGLVGYVSYDYYKYEEPVLKFENPDPYGFYDMHLMCFEDLIVFDHFRDKLILIANARSDDFENSFKQAQDRLEKMQKILSQVSVSNYPGKITEKFVPVYSKEEYAKKIDKAREYIIEGDIFQVVPSNRIKGKVSGSLFPAYRVMRSDNPSPYMYYFQTGDEEIAGASPETLVRLEGDVLSTFPIAGSRPRGKTREEDLALEEELLANEKELAEHNMLVDLGRNDLGRVSKYASVKVEDYLMIQRYSKIMHITSKVSGIIRDGITGVQALGAVLPAGTLSGAPKIRACQIIEELEEERRGPYGGAIGYLAFNGNMDMCIAIRSAFKSGEDVYIQSGGGIVYDSEADSEYTETVNKAAAVVEAIERGEELSYDINTGQL